LASGKVGIGTITPTYPLEVKGNIVNSNISITPGGYISLTGDLPGYANGLYPTLKTNHGNLYFSTGGGYTAYMGGGSKGQIALLNSGSIPVLINAFGDTYFTGGNVGIGTATPVAPLEVYAPFNGVAMWLTNSSIGAATIYARNTGTGYGVYGEAQNNGGTSNWVATSDYRMKKNVTTLSNSLQNILRLRGVSFDWRHDEFPQKNLPNKHDIGVIAQEVQNVYPEVVVTDPDGYLAVSYSNLIPALIEAVKEQQQMIDILNGKLTELDNVKTEIASIKKTLGLEAAVPKK
jgi:hypothetical protein